MVIGRGAELDRIRALLDAARGGRCGSLVVEGDPGVGKSTILAAAADLAGDGFTVLRTRGVESEAGLDHAALLAVLAPLRGLLADLPPGLPPPWRPPWAGGTRSWPATATWWVPAR